MKLITAVEEILEQDPRTRKQKYLWTFVIKVLNKMGYKAFVEMKRGMPSPESIITERRRILNSPKPKDPKLKDKYEKARGEFVAEEGVTYESPQENLE